VTISKTPATQPVKPTKTTKKAPTVKATNKKPPIPEYYLNDQPVENGRASIKIEMIGIGEFTADVPAKHLTSFTGLTVGVSAVAAPVAILSLACHAGLPAAAMVAVTAMMTGISLLALLMLFYTLHNERGQSMSY
jgi:hypothetical protein